MECRYEFCLYNQKNECTLQKISINEAGLCEDCIAVSLDTEMLAEQKNQQLKKLEQSYKND